jgi:SAM-dependent methyltransferase
VNRAARQDSAIAAESWVGWCCSYCSAALEARPHGLYCAAEGRFFAELGGVHRLLTEERRRERQPFLELYQRVRRDDGWKAEPGQPDVPASHVHARAWRQRALSLRRGLEVAGSHLGAGPWRVLDAGAGSCWLSAQLVAAGHHVVAIDPNLDPEDGLLAAPRLLDGLRLPRAEAEMESLPLEPQSLDLVITAGALHYAPRLGRALVELRRVTRRGGMLLVLDAPTYRRREDGEAMVAARMKQQTRRYGVEIEREFQSGYLVLHELAGVFSSAGWKLEVLYWPGSLRERLRDVVEIAKHGRRTARFPVIVGRRDG